MEGPETITKLDELLKAALLEAPVKIHMRGIHIEEPRNTFEIEAELTDKFIAALLPTSGDWHVGVWYEDVEICTVRHKGAQYETLKIDLRMLTEGLAHMAKELYVRRASIHDFEEQTGPRGWISRLFPLGQAE